ncbi:related to Probable endo-1,4-beta-xylanase C [Pseudozyma flocculosa]|uniref:Beta-xylanase n=1 Tax=Pseudozyma flocculosa TaxID=84751 RepID=A0A5C3F5B5_9BASI|nr:related to Probable endo-1,4-beta-xylanase C [Pseudozyma flocculosa]
MQLHVSLAALVSALPLLASARLEKRQSTSLNALFESKSNNMKWQSIEPSRGQFSFDLADQFVAFAQKNGLRARGHTLVWYQQLSPYVESITDKGELIKVMQEHISTVAGRYKGQLYAWDVVNEAFEEDGSFRRNHFYNVLGEQYIPLAFQYAKQADSKAKLYINDYNLDSATYAKTTALISNVKKWIAQGVPIDGIGSQMHLSASGFPSASTVGPAMKALCAAAPECAITELDIKQAAPSSYVAAVESCAAIHNCVGVTVWGTSDADSWRASDTPLLFDKDFKPKPAYDAVVKAIQSS